VNEPYRVRNPARFTVQETEAFSATTAVVVPVDDVGGAAVVGAGVIVTVAPGTGVDAPVVTVKL
jgi:hypothetical protein